MFGCLGASRNRWRHKATRNILISVFLMACDSDTVEGSQLNNAAFVQHFFHLFFANDWNRTDMRMVSKMQRECSITEASKTIQNQVQTEIVETC